MKKDGVSGKDLAGNQGEEGGNLPVLPETRDITGRHHASRAVNDKISELAWLLTDAEDYDRANEAYKSLSSETHQEVQLVGLSRILVEKRQFDTARELLREGLEQFPRSSCLLNNLGLLHYRTGQQYDALRYFDQALTCESGEEDTAVLYNKGLALLELAYFEEAAKVFTTLTERDGENPRFFCELGYCHLKRDNYWEAIQLYRHAMNRGEDSRDVYAGLCCAFMGAGMLMEAWVIADKGLQRYPEEEGMFENLAEVHLDLGRLKEAREVLEAGLNRFPESASLKHLVARAEEEEHPSFSKN